MKHFLRTEPAGQNLVLEAAPLYSSGIQKGQKHSLMEQDNCEGKEQAGIVQAAPPCCRGLTQSPDSCQEWKSARTDHSYICHFPSSDLLLPSKYTAQFAVAALSFAYHSRKAHSTFSQPYHKDRRHSCMTRCDHAPGCISPFKHPPQNHRRPMASPCSLQVFAAGQAFLFINSTFRRCMTEKRGE